MMARKKQRGSAVLQPVRFYKIVALSFLGLTIILLGVIMFMSAKRAVVTIITKPEPVDMTLTLTVGNGGEAGISSVVTTTAAAITEYFSPKGTREEEAAAHGVVVLHNELNIDQPLVATTRLLSKDGILFRLKNQALVPKNGTVEAEVYADKKGALGNIGPDRFTIPGLAASKQKVVYAISEQSMSGGIKKIGIVDESDIKKAEEKLTELLKQEGEKKLKEKFEELDGGTFKVVEQEFETDTELGDEVDKFKLEAKGTVLGVLYDSTTIGKWAQAAIVNRAISDAEIIEPSKEDPVVSLEEYELEEMKAVLSVFYTGIATLNPETKQLQKIMFFGKDKEEVRRYLLSLDHVHSVEVEFKPAWIQTVPHVADHVNIIVKSVE